jgi:hypothetical protein
MPLSLSSLVHPEWKGNCGTILLDSVAAAFARRVTEQTFRASLPINAPYMGAATATAPSCALTAATASTAAQNHPFSKRVLKQFSN